MQEAVHLAKQTISILTRRSNYHSRLSYSHQLVTPVMHAAAAAWYAEFLHHMRVQQPVNLVPYPNMWPWNYQSQMAAQAMNAAAMGVHAAPGGQLL